MLDVWNNGNFTGGYEEFVRRIRDLLPSDQQPNFFVTGKKNAAFEAKNRSLFSAIRILMPGQTATTMRTVGAK